MVLQKKADEGRPLNPFEQQHAHLREMLITGFGRLLIYTGKLQDWDEFNLLIAPILEQIADGTYNMEHATQPEALPGDAGEVLGEKTTKVSSQTRKRLLQTLTKN